MAICVGAGWRIPDRIACELAEIGRGRQAETKADRIRATTATSKTR
jgi:hypothetical protein